MSELLSSDVITVRELLAKTNLTIPVYQRPYRWSAQNINDLLTDLYYQTTRQGHNLSAIFNPDSTYRLGTIVLHNDNNSLSLVDGQQRTLTLMLIMHAAVQSNRFKEQLANCAQVAVKLPNCSETHKNLSENLEYIKQQVNSPDFTEEVLDFLLNHCELVLVILTDLSEAFQFFDSQNARGLDLSPHDLLKAFHLRAFPETENNLKQAVVDSWERQNTNDLKLLFSNYLYPIRRWSNGEPALYFSKANAYVFKGVNLSSATYPFQQGLNVIHKTVDSYNQHYHREIDSHEMSYPFQLTQTIINGRRFFEWVTHYQALVRPLLDTAIRDSDSNWLKISLLEQNRLQRQLDDQTSRPTAFKILQVLANRIGEEYQYTHSWRQGDRYVRRMFDSLVISYYDRFGEKELARAIEYIFVWAYTLRLRNQSVYLESIEKHIRENNLFMRLQQSLSPADFLNKPLYRLKITDIKIKNKDTVKGIFNIFKELNFYTQEKGSETENEK